MEIELYSRLNDPLTAIDRLGEAFAKSGMFGCEKLEQGKVLAMICLAEGKSPVSISMNYDIVEGKLRKKALAALADFRTAGGKHKWIKSGDDANANEAEHYAELELTDKEGNKNVYRYSMADARKEGLIKDKSRWVKRPGNMLRARCISNGLGMLAPEIFAGEDEEPFSAVDPKPLFTASAAPVTAPAVDVTATVVAEPAKTEPTKQPATEKPAEKKPFTTADLKTEPATGRLSVDSLAAIETAIGEANMPAAITWLKQKQWITDSLSELSVDRAGRILNKPQEFLGHITKVK